VYDQEEGTVRGTRLGRASVAVLAVTAAIAIGALLAVSDHGDTASAAETSSQAVTVARAALPAAARDVHGDRGGELLSVDLRGDGSAEVMFYDYATGLTHQITVDSGKVSEDQAAPGMQPPASSDETAAAFGIALRAPQPLPFTITFAQQQGVPLVSADQVMVNAEAWAARGSGSSAAGGDAGDAVSACATDRCMQLVVATAAGEYLDTSDFVVDLSAGRVLHLKGAS
jgi:hypothetical protein